MFWSLPAGVMGQHILSRQGNGDGVSKRQRERLPPYCNRSTYTTLASFIASFNLSFVLRDTEAINKQVEHPLHKPTNLREQKASEVASEQRRLTKHRVIEINRHQIKFPTVLFSLWCFFCLISSSCIEQKQHMIIVSSNHIFWTV